ncbi:MarC family protein [Porphyromonas levii]|uniref:UPF0056 membrane protein n=1 Tax=Porphyromonas levii TaxID=28114 RepID=A0A4Y8WRN7_9PORP|nr:MarC family protein [Porphyromonas levii]MBR8703942.1 hypothetical protein [Porphyromonas levii]MBR8713286.1 hypothetical protein [Porphyromonas levii]MBR8715304.1 hypothetical protein [Porphyromonas levii]MBR8727830.1 hypothetical protein [Porphyromonas levii]MBR8729455.1 hypothetical protein [Porphyromonas levii]
MDWLIGVFQGINFTEIGKVFSSLFVVIDIIGAIPIIINLKQSGQKIEPFKTVLFSTFILLAFLFFGELVLSFLGVTRQSFAAGGAIILFLLAVEMIFGVEIFRNDAPGGSSTLVPLVFPLIAGAASFTTLLTFTSTAAMINIVIATLMNMVVVYFVLRNISFVERIFGQGGIYVLRKFFGAVLMAISVNIFIENISKIVFGI